MHIYDDLITVESRTVHLVDHLTGNLVSISWPIKEEESSERLDLSPTKLGCLW